MGGVITPKNVLARCIVTITVHRNKYIKNIYMKYKPIEHTCVQCKKAFTTTTDARVQECEKCHKLTERDRAIAKMILKK